MAIQICSVSGLIKDTTGTAIAGVTVVAKAIRPFIHPSDGSLIVDYQASTTTDSSGAWSLSLIETETPQLTLTVSFIYPVGLNSSTDRQDFTVTVPNQSSATFSSLVSATNITQV